MDEKRNPAMCVISWVAVHQHLPARLFFPPCFLTSHGAHIYYKGRYKLSKTFCTSALLACIGVFWGSFKNEEWGNRDNQADTCCSSFSWKSELCCDCCWSGLVCHPEGYTWIGRIPPWWICGVLQGRDTFPFTSITPCGPTANPLPWQLHPKDLAALSCLLGLNYIVESEVF